ncbi:Dfm1p SCDLUD_003291 [Saccharomycodes ludwigii]|uniref:Dfm1p n=1 Tax=Saccharomycodes ludwigii TaxID=36035 RepID=UPI001E86898C|nr:hypothetical protein SCDLUD_003291 [Saccharomycodes ludwigii]KAH3900319.1 hypothetical protein SCDLUD_003291 [Saccharomycodes ludwigii]
MSDFSSIPPITKTLILSSTALSLLSIWNIIPMHMLFFYKFQPFLTRHLWRPITSMILLTPGQPPLNYLMKIYSTYVHSSSIELTLGNLHNLQMALSYTWSIINRYQEIRYMGLLPVSAKYVPIIELGINLIFGPGTSVQSSGILGLISAYIYNCIATKSMGPLYGFLLKHILKIDGRNNINGERRNGGRLRSGNNTNNKKAYLVNIFVPNTISNEDYGYNFGNGFVPTWFSNLFDNSRNNTNSTRSKNHFYGSNSFKGRGQRLGTKRD